ncbi:hypothetical protein HHK36_003052 [Tetracentron sinense]|uniref:Uncharacterized protein n=1 Tax=Tetracentron sinense TaxID=13715 RepID=A0A835DNZ3_TETSI|nr:hypothetical protein HHK36_003052 [Tetracentron sinense]
MGGGKIEIKRIENSSNRQVTFSKRRSGLFKKARELNDLYDTKVSLIIISATGEMHQYISPSTTTKQIFDQYQQTKGINLWSSHYEQMQDDWNKLKEINHNLSREIRQRTGEDINDLSIDEMCGLEQNMEQSLKIVRERKYRVISTQIEIYKKEKRNMEEIHRQLLNEFELRDDDPHYGLVDNGGEYESAVGLANGGSQIFAFHLQPSRPNLHDEVRNGFDNLRLD